MQTNNWYLIEFLVTNSDTMNHLIYMYIVKLALYSQQWFIGYKIRPKQIKYIYMYV